MVKPFDDEIIENCAVGETEAEIQESDEINSRVMDPLRLIKEAGKTFRLSQLRMSVSYFLWFECKRNCALWFFTIDYNYQLCLVHYFCFGFAAEFIIYFVVIIYRIILTLLCGMIFAAAMVFLTKCLLEIMSRIVTLM